MNGADAAGAAPAGGDGNDADAVNGAEPDGAAAAGVRPGGPGASGDPFPALEVIAQPRALAAEPPRPKRIPPIVP